MAITFPSNPTTGQSTVYNGIRYVFDGYGWKQEAIRSAGDVVCRMKNNATQTVTASTWTKVSLQTVTFDTSSSANTTNSRITPKVAGYYKFTGTVKGSATGLNALVTGLYKNGAIYKQGDTSTTSGTTTLFSVDDIIFMNGSTDYVELWGAVGGTSGTSFVTDCTLSAHLISTPSASQVAFSATKTTTQSCTSGVTFDVSFPSETYDTNGFYDNSTSRFQPTIAGFYQINWATKSSSTTSVTSHYTWLEKNGSTIEAYGSRFAETGTVMTIGYSQGSALVYLNGTTDYLSIKCNIGGAGTITLTTDCVFSGALINSGAQTIDKLTDTNLNTPLVGQSLVFNGTHWVNGSSIAEGTAVTASGAGVTFTNVPSWARHVSIHFYGMSFTAGTGVAKLRIGTSGSLETSGYLSKDGVIATAGAAAGSRTDSMANIAAMPGSSGSDLFYGEMILRRISGNKWICQSMSSRTTDNQSRFGVGWIELSGTMDTVGFICTSDQFDAGTINIQYEQYD